MILSDLEGIGRVLHAFSAGFPRSQLPDGRILPPERYDLKRAQAIAQEASSSLKGSFMNNAVRFASLSFEEAPFDGLSIGVTHLKEDNLYGLQIGLDPCYYRSGQMEEFKEGPGNKIEEALANALEIRRALQWAEVIIESPHLDSSVFESVERSMNIMTASNSLAAGASILSGVFFLPPTPTRLKIVFSPQSSTMFNAEKKALLIRLVEQISEYLRSTLGQSPYR